MESLLTRYIYPLEKRLVLSDHLGFSFDNPRTDYEISVVKEYLIRAYESGYDYKFPVYSDEPIITIEGILDLFQKALGENEYIKQVFSTYEREQVFEFISKIWIVARFDDEGLGEQLRIEHKKMRKENKHSFFMLDDDHPLIEKPKLLSDYLALLSLLVQSEGEDYFGRQIILDTEPFDPGIPVQSVWQEFLMHGVILQSYPDKEDPLNWTFFPYCQKKIMDVSAQLENAFVSGSKEKLLYIGSILKVASKHVTDIKTRILLLTSIIELLLTHNPDFNRFNVEDSINKQFQLKASLLIYLNDKRKDLNAIKKRLRTIYSQRSNIAHGNFQAFDKFASSVNKDEDEYIDNLVTDLYNYIRAIVEEYLKDKDLVEFLKAG